MERSWAFAGLYHFYSTFADVNHFSYVGFLCAAALALFAPSPPFPLDVFCEVSVLVSTQCDGAWWVPLTGLSWLPFRLACTIPSVWPGTFPTLILSMGLFLFLFYFTTLSRYNNNKEKITKIYKYDHPLNNWAIDVTFLFFDVILVILQLPNYWVAIKL